MAGGSREGEAREMQPKRKRKEETPLFALSRRDERILRTIHYYRYMTVLDVAHHTYMSIRFRMSYIS